MKKGRITMILLVWLFVTGMASLIAAAWYGGNETDELEDDADRRAWVDYLARRSQRRERRSRSRYSMSGWGQGRGCRG